MPLLLASIAYPNIDPIIFSVGPLAVRWYGLAYVAGFLIGGLVVTRLSDRWKLGFTGDDVVEMVLVAVVGLVAGARIGYVIAYGAGSYWDDPVSILRLWDGGMSFHGGFAGMVLGGLAWGRIRRIPFMTLADMVVTAAPAGILFGRLANFINGELWGRVTGVGWGMVFPSGGPLPRHPSQLYEAALEGALLLGIMLWLARREPPRPRGELFGWFCALYGVARIFAELFREPDAQLGFIGPGVTMGQLLSVPLLVAGIAIVVWARRRALPQEGLGRPIRATEGDGSRNA